MLWECTRITNNVHTYPQLTLILCGLSVECFLFINNLPLFPAKLPQRGRKRRHQADFKPKYAPMHILFSLLLFSQSIQLLELCLLMNNHFPLLYLSYMQLPTDNGPQARHSFQ